MWVVVAALIVTALWLVSGAVSHEGRDLALDATRTVWWWESSPRSTAIASSHALPPSHPLAQVGGLPPDSIG